MMYILEHCALFLLVPPSCCYQVCGQPIYELAVKDGRPSPRFLKQKYSRQPHSVLSGYLQRRFQSCRQYQAKAIHEIRKSRRRTWSKTQEGLDCSPLCSVVAQRTIGENPAKNKPVIWTSDHLTTQQKPSHCPSFAKRLCKRKWQDCCETSGKRMKPMQTEEGSSDLVCPESKNQLLLDAADSSASEKCAKSCSAPTVKPSPRRSDFRSQTSDVSHTALDDCNKFVMCDKALKPDCRSKTHGELSTNPKFNTWVPNLGTSISDASSVQMVAEKDMVAERGLKTHMSNLDMDSSDKISATATRIEKRSVLYCHRQLKERLPLSFVLNHLQRYRAGGQRLVEVIFLGSETMKQPGNPDPPSCKWRKKRLPKRYWQMRGVFQELLWNHARCPYVALLKKNCPVLVSRVDKIDPGQDCQKTGHQERGSFSRVQQANEIEDGVVGPSHEVLSRSSEKSKLTQGLIKQQASRESSCSNFIFFLKQHSSHWQVYAFVRDCLERVVPAALWGSSHNKCRFYKNVKKFISLGKFSSFSLQELTWKMRVSDCTWLRLTTGIGYDCDKLASSKKWVINGDVGST